MRGEDVAGFIFRLVEAHLIAPKVGKPLQHPLDIVLVEQYAVDDAMIEFEAAVADEIDIDDLNVRIATGDIIQARERATYLAIAAFIMDRGDKKFVLILVVVT